MARNKRASILNKNDKPFMKKTMRDVVPVFDEENNTSDEVNDTVDVFAFDEDFNNKLIEYNENIKTIDPDFAKLKTFNKILVRMHVNPLRKNEDGLLIPSEEVIQVPTKAGYGNLMALRNPWPFNRRAVIISGPEYSKNDFSPGDEVLLSGNVTEGKLLGSGDQGFVDLPFKFLHPDFVEGQSMPLDPSHKGYGYMLIPPQLLEIKL
jgi:hypothetical protein